MTLPKFEDWTPPWGSDENFDAEKAKKLLYNRMVDDEARKAKLTELTTERDSLQTKVNEFETKDLSEMDKLRRELEQAKAAPKGDPLEVVRLKLALKEGLTESQVRRLVGSTEEELAADAAAYKQELGLTKADDEGDDDGEDDTPPAGPPSRRPKRSELRTGLGDVDGGDDTDSFDPAKLQEQLARR